ncbi:MAG: endonuclease MutS2 [Myxococcales bacterium]
MKTDANVLSPPRSGVGQRALDDLKWGRLLERLAACCATEEGASFALRTPLLARIEDVRAELGRVGELRALRDTGAIPPFGGILSLGQEMDRAGKEGILTREPLVKIADTLAAASRLWEWFDDREEQAPLCLQVAALLPDLSELAHVLHTTFDGAGQIRDDASPELGDLRRRLVATSSRVRAKLESYVGSLEAEDVLQDSYYTIRDGRYVLPVKSSMKPTFRGIIHGSSQTGATVFVEPEALIPLNNELKLLHDAVEREEHLVLRDRTERVVSRMGDIRWTVRVLASLDHLAARARLAHEMEATAPVVNDQGRTRLLRARNPHLLLKGSDVVPNDVPLHEQWQLLVVTGPNTGGKSVTLSTFGLCTLMTMAGMHIPAAADSEVGLFDQIFTVFGDAHSIEQDLSTFSGHLKLLGEVLDAADDHTLVLMDEIVVGTEPTGGAALAMAVLEALATRGVRGLVTTHYDRLKTMALGDGRFRNGSVGIDLTTMTPTWRLSIGTPGSSSPIEMASKLGMDPRVVERATALIGSQTEELQSALAALEREREALAAERAATITERERQRETMREVEAERARMKQRGLEIAREMQKDVLRELEKARDVARAAVAALQAEKDPRRIDEARRRIDRAAAAVRAAVDPQAPAPNAPTSQALGAEELGRLTEGTRVWVRSLSRAAVVGRVDSARKIEVVVGRARMTTELENLAWPPDAPAPPQRRAVQAPLTPVIGDDAPPRTSEWTVDLRGLRVEEGLEELVRRMDQALLEGRTGLWLIHGHGSGAMKQAVRELCDRSRYVRKWRPGEREDGGDGVTLAWLADD